MQRALLRAHFIIWVNDPAPIDIINDILAITAAIQKYRKAPMVAASAPVWSNFSSRFAFALGMQGPLPRWLVSITCLLR